MRTFTHSPLKKKLTRIIMATTSVALLLAVLAFALYEIISFRRAMPQDLAVLARITGENGRSALEFDDAKFAEETLLASLAAQPRITTACLYDRNNQVFAKYVRKDLTGKVSLPRPQPPGHAFASDHLNLFWPVTSAGQKVGLVFLQSDLKALYSRITTYAGICALVLVAALFVAWLMSLQLQRVVSEPILKLAETTAQVARQKNYSVRVVKQSKDELGSLYDGFNEMLSQIEQRDAALQQIHRDLEKRVEDRTADLTRANTSLTEEVSVRQRAEVALRVSQHKFETLVNSIEGVVWEADPLTYEFTFVSQQAEQLLGFPREMWIRDQTFWQSHLLAEDRPRALEFVGQAVARKKPFHFEYRMKTADGRVVWIRDSASVVLEGDKPVLLRGVLLDVTEQKQAEQELENMHKRLLETSRRAGMAEVATGVLHNVGNVLNSVNVSATLVCDRVRNSRLPGLTKTVALMREREADLGNFLTNDDRGKLLPNYVSNLAGHLGEEHAEMLKELESLTKNIEHIKDIVAMQQNYARVSGLVESLSMADLVEDALQFNAAAFTRHGVEVVREFKEVPPITVDKHKVLQILVNLMHNAKYAMDEAQKPEKQLLLGIDLQGLDRIKVTVKDNGIGIKPENLTRIFSHGFTTKKNGHGFGLHSGALAAKEMGGSLTAQSDGPGRGATFILELPLAKQEDAQ